MFQCIKNIERICFSLGNVGSDPGFDVTPSFGLSFDNVCKSAFHRLDVRNECGGIEFFAVKGLFANDEVDTIVLERLNMRLKGAILQQKVNAIAMRYYLDRNGFERFHEVAQLANK